MDRGSGIERRRRILEAALEGAVVEPAGPDEDGDFVARTADGRTSAFRVHWGGEGWTEEVRRATARVDWPWPEDTIMLAGRLSLMAVEWLRECGGNWADEVGQVRIISPGVPIVIRGPAEARGRKEFKRPLKWSESTISIGETILTREDKVLRVGELAAESDWSKAQAATVMTTFDERGWTAKQGPSRGPTSWRAVVDPDGLLAAWADGVAATRTSVRVADRADADPMTLLRGDLAPALAGVSGWAVGGWAGLELAMKRGSAVPDLHVYVADTEFFAPLREAIAAAGLKEVEEGGGRVTFWATDPRVFALAREIEGIPVVSSPRLYADLRSFGERGADAAARAKAELIDPPRGQIASGR